MDFIDEQRSADLLDAMADLAYEQEQAMRESERSDWSSVDDTDDSIDGSLPKEWDGIEEISVEERNACDHYNERYSSPTYD